MSKIRIITDSGSDISPARAAQLNIRLLPISFTFDGEHYIADGVDITHEEFYTRLRENSTIPKTTQITPAVYQEAFNEEIDNGYDTLIVVTISSSGSGMYQNAVLSAQEVSEERGVEIHVIDSGSYSCMYGAPVIHAAKMLRDGADKDAVLNFLNDVMKTMHAYFLVSDLKHLKKGGRINAATLVIANMLDIRPVLVVENGLVVQKDKLRGSKRIWKKLIQSAKDNGCEMDKGFAIIVHTSQIEKYKELKSELENEFDGINVMQCPVGVTIGSHGGPDLVGFVYSDKYDLNDYED